MRSELEDLTEHLERLREVTLSFLDAVGDEELSWRPTPEQYSLGQQLLHIAQAEDLYAHGLFEFDWDYERVRFPAPLPTTAEIRDFFVRVRARTREHLARLDPARLGEVTTIPGSPLEHSLRSWLWFLVEHEMHHKAQVAGYLRLLGRVPPFYAMPLEPGARPDIEAREELGGFR
jgi:uncharacterized damage-inducible protein DinB